MNLEEKKEKYTGKTRLNIYRFEWKFMIKQMNKGRNSNW